VERGTGQTVIFTPQPAFSVVLVFAANLLDRRRRGTPGCVVVDGLEMRVSVPEPRVAQNSREGENGRAGGRRGRRYWCGR